MRKQIYIYYKKKRDIQDDIDMSSQSAVPPTQQDANQLYNDLHKSIEEEEKHIRQSNTTKLRQKLLLITLLHSIDDILANEAGVIPITKVRTCRLILQGEGGVGKSWVLKKAEEYLMRYLGCKRYKIFAATHQAYAPSI
jgi:hypothetical protein